MVVSHAQNSKSCMLGLVYKIYATLLFPKVKQIMMIIVDLFAQINLKIQRE